MVKLLDDVGGVLLVSRGAEEGVSLAVLVVGVGADGGRGGEVEEQEEKDEDEDDRLHAAGGDPGELIFFLLLADPWSNFYRWFWKEMLGIK